ncbi:hypothetical protein BJV82DRAFT_600671 [Fennellomyces sp. T-0311]|nr:hypothetical protein BJV82DRAFT_600671 [Fennellomyces sp. T-0311]
MNDSVSILVAVFLILVALRWMLGGSQQLPGQQGGQRRAPSRRPQHRATPQMVEMVRAVFPNIPVAAIVADLQRTGSVETTIDNALRDGGLPLPPPTTPQNSPGTGNANGSSSTGVQKSSQYTDLMVRYKIKNEGDDNSQEPAEPPKIWEASPDKRQETLRKRKEFMVLQARRFVVKVAYMCGRWLTWGVCTGKCWRSKRLSSPNHPARRLYQKNRMMVLRDTTKCLWRS